MGIVKKTYGFYGKILMSKSSTGFSFSVLVVFARIAKLNTLVPP
jgi:hypothetical protein